MKERGQKWRFVVAEQWWRPERTEGFTHTGGVEGVAHGGEHAGARVTGQFRLEFAEIGPVQVALRRVWTQLEVGEHRIEAERELGLVDAALTLLGMDIPGRMELGTGEAAEVALRVPLSVVRAYLTDVNLPGCGIR